MIEPRVIKCDVKPCDNQATEPKPDDGWIGWGSIKGLKNPETGATEAFVCPDCLQKVAKILDGK